MMTATIRSLALFSACCLWAGCSERAPVKKSAPSASEVVPPSPTLPNEAAGHVPTLSATAQDRPASVADLPLPAHQPEPAAQTEKTTEVTQTDGSKNAQSASAEADDVKDALDFDRDVDPAEVQIERFVLATGVTDREPVGETDTFASDTKEIYAFVQFANPSAPYALRVHWEKVDGPAFPYGFKMEIPTAPRWRTWSWTRIQREPGHYRAVLRTLKGVDVASREFEIVPR